MQVGRVEGRIVGVSLTKLAAPPVPQQEPPLFPSRRYIYTVYTVYIRLELKYGSRKFPFIIP